MVPHFASESDPVLHQPWAVPPSIRLRYICNVAKDGSAYYLAKSWLLAFSESGACWRLPLANIYDDCALCTGDFGSHSESALGSLKLAMKQFKNSKWNADLWDDNIREKTIKFFRFDPSKTPFVQLPIDSAAWTNLCLKIATPITEQVVL